MRNLRLPLLIIAFVLGVLGPAVALRLRNVGQSPAWFRDEGTYAALVQDRGFPPRLGPLDVTFVGPYMTQPPAYFLLTQVLAAPFPGDALGERPYRTIRAINAAYGLLTLLLVFLLARQVCSLPVAFLAAFLFATDPNIVLYHRMVLPYNLAQVLATALALFLVRYFRDDGRLRHLIGATACAAAASVSAYYSAVLVPITIVAAWLRDRRPGRWIPLLAALPLPVLLLYLSLVTSDGFFDDTRALARDAAPGSIHETLRHYWHTCQASPLVILGAVGLFFIRKPPARLILLALLFAQAHMVLRRASTWIPAVPYPLCPLYPFLVIGAAQVVETGGRALAKGASRLTGENERLGVLARGAVWATLGLSAVYLLYWQVSTTRHFARYDFITPLRHSMVANPYDTREVASYINERVTESDLVIADQIFWPLLQARVTNPPQLIAYRGAIARSDFYRYPISQSRFAYSPELSGARYFVEDTRLRNRKIDPPDSAEYAILLEASSQWRLRLELGEYRVWENPALAVDIPILN